MIQKLQHLLNEATHGMIYSKKEAVYVLIIIVLAFILLASLIVRAIV